jgi:hypothetical protein
MMEILVILGSDIKVGSLKTGTRTLNELASSLFGIAEEEDIVYVEPRLVLTFLCKSMGISSGEVQLIYNGDGRTSGSKTSTVLTMKIRSPVLTGVFPIAILNCSEKYDIFARVTATLRQKMKALSGEFTLTNEQASGLSSSSSSSSSSATSSSAFSSPPSSSKSSSSQSSSSSPPPSTPPSFNKTKALLAQLTEMSEDGVGDAWRKNVLGRNRPLVSPQQPLPPDLQDKLWVTDYMAGDLKYVLFTRGLRSVQSS